MKLKLVKGSAKPGRHPEPKGGEAKAGLEDQVDALFKLPLAEFTDARNTLAARLKQDGSRDDAALVKALAKPSVSAWAVNQLYWNHREAFDRLIASGERVHKVQASGKVADMREALDARRKSLAHLSDLAAQLLQVASHNPSLDIVRRITSTLEAMSIYASRADAPRPGRLTGDVDPPGFESLASWATSIGARPEAGDRQQTAGTTAAKTPKPTPKSSDVRTKRTTNDDARRNAEAHKAKTAAAKVSLQNAKSALVEARAKVQGLKASQKKAELDAKKADQRRRSVEEELRKAKAASEAASRLVRSVAVEIAEAESGVDDADRMVHTASKALEALVRRS